MDIRQFEHQHRYEGLPTNHKIACVYNERKDPLMIKEQEGEADFEKERRAGKQ